MAKIKAKISLSRSSLEHRTKVTYLVLLRLHM